jgi:hypothetical protein
MRTDAGKHEEDAADDEEEKRLSTSRVGVHPPTVAFSCG